MKHFRKPILLIMAFLLATVLIPGIGLAAASATTMQLAKTEGTVSVSDAAGKPVSVRANLKLYDGYDIKTSAKSFAWIELDSTKMVKLDASSDAVVNKDGKKLEIDVSKGKVFFNITEPLKDNESLNIRTATMTVGIRGTAGWIDLTNGDEASVSVLEGTVAMTVSDPQTGMSVTESVTGGETVSYAVNEQTGAVNLNNVTKKEFNTAEVPGFVLQDVAADPQLAEAILEKSGGVVDLRAVTPEQAETRVQQEQAADTAAPATDTAAPATDTGAPASQPANNPAASSEELFGVPGLDSPNSIPTSAADAMNAAALSASESTASVQPAPSAAASSAPTPSAKPKPTPEPSTAPTPVPLPTPTPITEAQAAPTPVPLATQTPASAPTPAPTVMPLPTPEPSVMPHPTPAPTATPQPTPAPTVMPQPTLAPAVPPQANSVLTTPQPTPTITPQPTLLPKYTVYFDFGDMGVWANTNINAGDLANAGEIGLNKLADFLEPNPQYFGGWYKDAAYTQPWDLKKDTVHSDITLYAKWINNY